MAGPDAAPHTDRDRLVDEIEVLMRRMTTESERLGHEFAAKHGLHATDLEALVHVMDAERGGGPLTPGQLAARLRLSSGATTAVIDRLERQGHIRRERDAGDRRKVHLHHAEYGMAVALDFFGGLVTMRDRVIDPMTDADLAVVRDFLSAWIHGVERYRTDLHDGAAPPAPEAPPPA